jgi:hypothetical protein
MHNASKIYVKINNLISSKLFFSSFISSSLCVLSVHIESSSHRELEDERKKKIICLHKKEKKEKMNVIVCRSFIVYISFHSSPRGNEGKNKIEQMAKERNKNGKRKRNDETRKLSRSHYTQID